MGDLDYKRDYEERGFAVVRGFLPPNELSELKREVERFLREVAPTLGPDQAFYHRRPGRPPLLRQLHRMNVDPFFETYRRHPRWNQLARALVGEAVTANPPIWLNKPPNTDFSTPPHQDNYAFCMVPPNLVMIFVALERIDVENGCLRYVPGSHRLGHRLHTSSGVLGFSQGIADFTSEDEMAEVAVELDPGDAVGHHPETIHRALPNSHPHRTRQAVCMTFHGESARRDEEAYEQYERVASRLEGR